jgi:hypothetical protein
MDISDGKTRGGDSGTLRELVLRHNVRLSVYREYGPDESDRQHPVGFEVDLRGLVVAEKPIDDEEAQRAAYRALHEVGSWVFGFLDETPTLTYELDAFDGHVVYDTGKGAVEVELTGHILHEDGVRRELDEDERRALGQVRERLRSLGVPG